MSEAAREVLEKSLGSQGRTAVGQGLSITNRTAIIAVLALTFIAYAGTLGYQFVYDDRSQIVENSFVQSWANAPQFFTEHVWQHVYPNIPGNYYRPIFMMWLLLNYTLFGLNAFFWHLTTVAVHLVATVLVYVLARRLLKDEVTAAIAALVFGLHPVHLESVAWVSGVTDPLLAVFLIPSFLFYLTWRERQARGAKGPSRWLVASAGMYILAMLSKETALMLPMMIFTYEWIYGTGAGEKQRFGSRALLVLRSVALYVALTVIYLTVRTIVLKGFSHILTPLPASTIILTWPSLLWFYIKLLVWPVGLSIFYDTPYITRISLSGFVLPLIAVITFGALLWVLARKSKEMAFASVLLVLPLVPLMNLSVFFQNELAHDRYLYMPSIGFSIIVALVLRRIKLSPIKVFGQPAAQMGAVIVLTGLLAIGTVTQSIHWASNLLLYYRGVRIAPNNDIAHNDLASLVAENQMYDEAIALYKTVLDRNPTYYWSNYNLGLTYYKIGALEEADHYLNRAVELDQRGADAFLYLGLARMKRDRLDEAAYLLRIAVGLRPEAQGYHYALGTVLKKQGDLQSALEEFKAELLVNPGQAAARDRINEIEARQGGNR